MQNKINKDGNKPTMNAMSFKETTSQTKQSYHAGTKVDNILKQYQTLGVNDLGMRLHASVMQQPFGNFDSVRDYQTQLNTVIRVNEYFKSLPSGIRDRFRNQPGAMVDFMADPRNRDEAVKLGLFPDPKKEGKAEPGTKPPPPPEPEKK